MNRRAFLSGLLGTTAVVSAAVAFPAIAFAPLNKVREFPDGSGWYDEWKPGTVLRFKTANTGPATIGDKWGVHTIYKNGRPVVPGDIAQDQIIRRVNGVWTA